MPAHLIHYTRGGKHLSLVVQASDVMDAIGKLQDKHLDAEINAVSTVGKSLSQVRGPMYTTREGNPVLIRNMRTDNIRAVLEHLEAGGDRARGTGIYQALAAELETR